MWLFLATFIVGYYIWIEQLGKDLQKITNQMYDHSFICSLSIEIAYRNNCSYVKVAVSDWYNIRFNFVEGYSSHLHSCQNCWSNIAANPSNGINKNLISVSYVPVTLFISTEEISLFKKWFFIDTILALLDPNST